jgi:hypothetical protein
LGHEPLLVSTYLSTFVTGHALRPPKIFCSEIVGDRSPASPLDGLVRVLTHVRVLGLMIDSIVEGNDREKDKKKKKEKQNQNTRKRLRG